MPTTPILGLPELAQNQANPDVTHNTAVQLLCALSRGVKSLGDNAPPGSPSDGDSYVLGAAPTGAWAGRANCLAVYVGGAWSFVPGNDDAGTPIAMGAAHEGLRFWVQDENQYYIWTGSPQSWTVFPLGNDRVFPASAYASIQAAINAANAAGGGRVPVSESTAERITLKDNVYVILEPGVTLSDTGVGTGVVVGSPGNNILTNAGLEGYGAYIDMGTTGTKGVEVISAWNCVFRGFTLRGNSTTSFGLDVRGDASGGSNPVGGRHVAYCTFSDIMHEGTCGTKLRLLGTNSNSGYVTLNSFTNVDAEDARVRGYDFAAWCDNNIFDGNHRVEMNANNAVGAEFNTSDPTNNVGVYSIVFTSLAVDTFAVFTGRVGVKLNNCKDINIWHFFQDPPAEGGPVVVDATNTGAHYIRWFDDNNGVVRIYQKAQEFNTALSVRQTGTPGLLPGTSVFTLECNDAGANGPAFVSYHNSASPAASDITARWDVYGKDSGGNDTLYVAARAILVDPTNGSEDARWSLRTTIAGAEAERVSVGAGLYTAGVSDMGANTINATTLHEAGTSLASKYGALASANSWTNTNTFVAPSAAANNIVLQSNDAGSIGTVLASLHNSASPAVGDQIFNLSAVGMTSLAAQHVYGQFYCQITDPTSGSTDALWVYNARIAGAQTQVFKVGDGLVSGSPTGDLKGVGTVNATSYYTNNNLSLDTDGVSRMRSYTVGTLPAASGKAGGRAYVTDANATFTAGIGATVAGGGANVVPVFSDGTNWRIG